MQMSVNDVADYANDGGCEGGRGWRLISHRHWPAD